MGVKRFFKVTERESKDGDHSVTVSGFVDQDMVTHITNVEVEKVTKIEPKPLLSDAKVGEEWVDDKGDVWEIIIVGLHEPYPIRVRYFETLSISSVNLDGHHALGNFRLVSRKQKPSEEVGISKTESINEPDPHGVQVQITIADPWMYPRGTTVPAFISESEAIRAGEAAKAQREERETIKVGDWYLVGGEISRCAKIEGQYLVNTDGVFSLRKNGHRVNPKYYPILDVILAQTTKGRGEG